MRERRFLGRVAAMACLALCAACGGDETRAPESGAAPGGEAPAAAAANAAPRVERLRLEPAEPLPGDRVRAIATVRDPDGDRLTQGFRWRVAGRELAESGSEIELGPAAKGDEVEVWVTASDGRAESEPAYAAVRVANRRPVLENVALQPVGSVLPGQPAVATPLARDPDGDELAFRYRWTLNEEEVPGQEEATFPTAGLRPGDAIRVQVVASDGEGESDAAWSGVLHVGNAAPEITSRPAGAAAGQPFHYHVAARDPEGDRNLRYLLRTAPQGMTLNPVLGDLRWEPRPDQAGVHPVEIAVEDSAGARSVQVFELTVGGVAPAAPAPAPAAPEE
jgi:hypothetical protein